MGRGTGWVIGTVAGAVLGIGALGIVCAAGPAGAAKGPEKPGEATEERPLMWIDDEQQGLTQGRYSGRPTVILFWSNWCGYCEQMEKFFLSREGGALGQRAVLVLADVNRNPELLAKYKVQEHHQIVVVEWDGKEVGRFGWTGSAKQFYEEATGAIGTNDAAAARKLYEAGRFAKAAQRAQEVTASAQNAGPEAAKLRAAADEAEDVTTLVKKKSLEEIASAQKLLTDGRNADALQACDAIEAAFPAQMVGTSLKELRREIRAAGKGKPVNRPEEEAKPEPGKQARDLVDRGMVLEWDGKYLEAVRAYEQAVKEFPNEAAAAEAKGRLEKLTKDPTVQARIKEAAMDQQCQRMMNLARAWAMNGRAAEARTQYLRVIQAYPGSKWAAAAAQELKGVK